MFSSITGFYATCFFIFRIFERGHRNLVCRSRLFDIVNFFYVISALYPAGNPDFRPHIKPAREVRVFTPYYAGYVIRSSVPAVYGKHDIAYFAAERGFSENRLFADGAAKENRVFIARLRFIQIFRVRGNYKTGSVRGPLIKGAYFPSTSTGRLKLRCLHASLPASTLI